MVNFSYLLKFLKTIQVISENRWYFLNLKISINGEIKLNVNLNDF